MEIHEHMAMKVMEIYVEALEAARHQEQTTGKRKAELETQKRSIDQMSRTLSSIVPLTKCQMTHIFRLRMVCEYCRLLGHTNIICRRALGMCLRCGVADH